ncbi:Fe2+-dependent dioxygenase [Ramlibacter sp. XY19]|uniref:Fe2+-dependent dioxygenase n=1 Tax=Ramlibacter paludis TaxID=2908000 RepID=UPI0023DB25FB|nr:Fe2+-dependent dioxygenase [Ramlibacter paludis]MCG2592591.1 Fe2+-dependent dioxygenase [Ramlibacter paludis]
MLLNFSLLDAQALARARPLLARAPWADGRDSAGAQAAQAKNNTQMPRDCAEARQLSALVLQALDGSPMFLAAALPARIYPPRFNRYRGEANHYGPHVDSAVRFGENGLRVRTDLSCTVFFSDPDAYDGGELVLHGPDGEQSVKLPAGQAVLYPASLVHEVRPVTRGERVGCFFWVQSLVRSAEQRRLLLEFDQALTTLRQREGDSPATVALTGTYHNLLRMWSET